MYTTELREDSDVAGGALVDDDMVMEMERTSPCPGLVERTR